MDLSFNRGNYLKNFEWENSEIPVKKIQTRRRLPGEVQGYFDYLCSYFNYWSLLELHHEFLLQ